jgi:hypothetical protein
VTSMYPRHRPGESVYELRFRPLPDEQPGHLQHNMTISAEMTSLIDETQSMNPISSK